MQRLTEKRDGHNVIPLRQGGKHKWAVCPDWQGGAPVKYLYGDHADRLATYEDTGLEPEEIMPVRFLIAAEKDPQKLARLRELVQADEDGRLVVLPCRVGDPVWVTMAYGRQFDQPIQGYVRWFKLHDDELMYLEAGIWMDIGEGKKEYGYSADSFGKIVHLTREEAEAALEGGKDHA